MDINSMNLENLSVEGLDKNIYAISEALTKARSVQSISALKKILEHLLEMKKEVKKRELDMIKFKKDKWKV